MVFVYLKMYSMLFVHHLLSVLLVIAIPVLLPIVFVILMLLQIYRQFVAQLLAVQYGQLFRGLLEGSDVVWAGENQSSRAMANALFLFENTRNLPNVGDVLLYEFRKRFNCRLHDTAYQKMFWELRYQWGFYFWLHRQPSLSVDYYVKALEHIPISDISLTRRELCRLIGSLSNRYCKGTSWELLVGSQPVSHGKGHIKHYPVLFRYHHSISDGIAILRLFCEDFIDEGASTTDRRLLVWNPEAANSVTLNRLISARSLMKMALTAPRYALHELVLKQEINPFLHGVPGEDKITSWVSEDTSAPYLIRTIKNVKLLLPGVSFTDVFMTAFAMSLRSYCEKYGHDVPASLTVALMRRFGRETKEIRLRNLSSAVLQTLPVGNLPVTGYFPTCNSIPKLLQQIHAVKSHSDVVLASTYPMITNLIVSHLPNLLPAPIVIPLLARSKFTVGMSNIPAFDTSVAIGGFTLKDGIFWVPNVAGNMLGLSLLTLNNRLQLGLIADRRIIPSPDELDAILNGTMLELRNMENILQRSTA